MRKHILLAAAASLALAPAAAFAQSAAPAPMKKPAEIGQQQSQLKPADEKFVHSAAISGAFEIRSSELALNKAESAEVKDFAQMMVRDHGKANRELMTLAKEMGAELPKALDNKHSQAIQKLGGLSGPAFDRMYIQAQLDAHNEAVALFRNYGEFLRLEFQVEGVRHRYFADFAGTSPARAGPQRRGPRRGQRDDGPFFGRADAQAEAGPAIKA